MKKLLSLLTLSLITLSLTAQSSDLKEMIDKRADELEEQVIEWRRYFHENPELSNREFNTAKKIAEHLESLGMEVQTEIAHTGVVGILKGGKPGPVVGLRADIDALPVIERTDVPFKSTVMGEYQGNEVGVMHACGHDTHIAILMGVAQILTEMKDDLKGTVKFIFQPAEEGAPKGEEGGAELMVKEGVLKNPDVDAIFGLHISDDTPVGEIEYRPKGIMASVNSFDIKVTGKQAHGSAPWSGIDPIVTSAQIINNIQTIVSRSMPLTRQAAVVTVGVINGGVRNNIIPEEVTMQGTIRALDEEMRQLIFKRLETVVQNTAESNGAVAELTINKGYSIT
jgi:amidohydrolase